MNLKEIGWRIWTEITCLRLETSWGLLWTRWWTFGFHKLQRSS